MTRVFIAPYRCAPIKFANVLNKYQQSKKYIIFFTSRTIYVPQFSRKLPINSHSITFRSTFDRCSLQLQKNETESSFEHHSNIKERFDIKDSMIKNQFVLSTYRNIESNIENKLLKRSTQLYRNYWEANVATI